MDTIRIDVKGELYTLVSKQADRWGEYRFNLSKEGQDKPYSMSVSSTLYRESAIPGYGCSCKGWIFHRKCKHIAALHALMQKQAA